MWKLGISLEEEFLSETSTGLLSSSKPNFRDMDQEIWLGETLGNSNPSSCSYTMSSSKVSSNTMLDFHHIKLAL